MITLWLALACSAPPASEGLPATTAGASAPAPEASAAAPSAPAPAPAAQVPEKAQKAGEIARAIEAQPDRVDAILQEHGTTRSEFEALLFEIAGDPQLAVAYGRARSGR